MFARRFFPGVYWTRRFWASSVPTAPAGGGYFARRFWAARYFAARFWPAPASVPPTAATGPSRFASVAVLVGPDPYRSTAEPD